MKYFITFNTAIVLIIIFLMSCSNNLERRVAKNQISDCFKSNCNSMARCTFQVPKTWISDYGSNGRFCSVIITNPPRGHERKMLNYFFEKGLLKLEKEVVYKNCAYWTINTVKIADSYSNFLINETSGSFEILSATFDVDEITGIIQEQDATKSIVEYKIKRNSITPFGEFWDNNCHDVDRNYQARFVKYDDGWRINK